MHFFKLETGSPVLRTGNGVLNVFKDPTLTTLPVSVTRDIPVSCVFTCSVCLAYFWPITCFFLLVSLSIQKSHVFWLLSVWLLKLISSTFVVTCNLMFQAHKQREGREREREKERETERKNFIIFITHASTIKCNINSVSQPMILYMTTCNYSLQMLEMPIKCG